MVTHLTKDDEGKPVIDADGEQIGLVVDVSGETAHIDPDPGVIDRIGARFGWQSESGDTQPLNQARIASITDDAIRLRPEVEVSFQAKQVVDTAEYQHSFYGSSTYYDDTREHELTREFEVYTDPTHRSEEGHPVADVHERHTASVTTDTTETQGDTDRELLEEHTEELVVEIDPNIDGMGEKSRIEDFCREWHTDHTPSDRA